MSSDRGAVGPSPNGFTIRTANRDDLQMLPAIEIAAGDSFRDLGMVAVAEDEPMSAIALAEYQLNGRCWVAEATAGPGLVLGYLIAQEVDGCCHIEQVTVHPDAAGNGIGRCLLGWAERWGSGNGMAASTLTTFVDVPWNGPYYLRLGYRYLEKSEETPSLRAIRNAEREQGLDRWPRACMRREIIVVA